MRILFFSVFLMLWASFLSAQMPVQTAANKRTLSYDQAVYSNAAYIRQQSIRIQSGQVWVNGNLVPKQNLPPGLRNLRPEFFMETILTGGSEYRFNLFGEDYLLKSGTLTNLQSPDSEKNERGLAEPQDVKSQQEYYSVRKNSNPQQFNRQLTEAEINQRCMSIASDYLNSPPENREALKAQLDACLKQWFELSMENREKEINQSQAELDRIRKDLEFRRRNSQIIIDNQRKDLIGK